MPWLEARLSRAWLQVYRYIEPLYSDFRKVRQLNADGSYALAHVDELAEAMIFKDFLFDIALPRIPKRIDLEVCSPRDWPPDVCSSERCRVSASKAGKATLQDVRLPRCALPRFPPHVQLQKRSNCRVHRVLCQHSPVATLGRRYGDAGS